jgi:DedD protein
MDHELKQRLIGAAVVTALCAIFIPMLFDDPVDNSGQLVSELNIPTPAEIGAESDAKLPNSAEQVLKTQYPEPLSTEAAGDTIESTGAEEESAEPETAQSKQRHSNDALYSESEGYARDDNGGVDADIPLSKGELEDRGISRQVKPHAVQSKPLSTETAKNPVSKAPVHVEVKDVVNIKKALEPVKPIAVKKPASEPTVIPTIPAIVKQPNTAKSLATAVAEAKTPLVEAKVPVVTPKAIPKLVRWYIQVGSFSKKENATSLWDSLHQQGLPASLDTVQTEKGISYRLRVGPELDGKKAAAMKERLDKQNIKAILMSE